ncbi:MAG: hypothetical protein R6U63_08860 [Longimicrobiales bacterium]
MGISGFSAAQIGPNPQPGYYRTNSPVLGISAGGSRVDTVGVFPSTEVEVRTRGEGMSFGPARFGRNLSYGVLGNDVLVGTADRLEVDIYTPQGRLARRIRAPDVSNDLTPEMESTYRDRLRETFAGLPPEQRIVAQRSAASIDFPSKLPAYSAVYVDACANIWVAEYPLVPGPAQRFLVFGRHGGFISVVEVPRGFRLLTITDGEVWGYATNDLGVERVVGYRLMK